jgi:ribosomal protein L11 methylase PrmA
LYPLSAKEKIKFKKSLIMRNEIEKIEESNNINNYVEKAKIFEEFLNDEKKLEEKNIDDIKQILTNIEEFNNIQKNLLNEEMQNDIEYIKNKFEKLRPLLVQRMRILNFNKK